VSLDQAAANGYSVVVESGCDLDKVKRDDVESVLNCAR
jgi:hypothetical protein